MSLTGNPATGNVVQGNYIGTDVTGTAPLANLSYGVSVSFGASANLIGGASSVDGVTGKLTGAGNVIAASGNAGVRLQSSSGNLVQGNFVGTDVFGTTALANNTSGDTLGAGVSILTGAAGNTIGGASTRDANDRLAGLGNLISGNTHDGVLLNTFSRTPVANNLVQGNWIGTDVTGTRPLGNTGDGVDFGGNARNNTLGGTGAGLGNLISANGTGGLTGGQQAGVQFHIPSDTIAPGNNTVLGNRIGTDITGTQPLGNRGDGVLISESAGNTIGGTAAGNLIAFNAGRGVAVIGNTSTGDAVLGNALVSNGGLGIDLGGDGVTLNDSAGHTGPNHFQNFPVLTSATKSSAGTTVAGTLHSTANAPFHLEFFSSIAA